MFQNCVHIFNTALLELDRRDFSLVTQSPFHLDEAMLAINLTQNISNPK